MQMIQNPTAYDVIVTENTMGDILSDEASVIVGSLGLLPSASLGDETWVVDGVTKKRPGLFEPVHGSAPDIAGQDKSNPIAMIMSLAMMLRNSLKDDDLAKDVEQAVATVIRKGYRTPDLFKGGSDIAVGTEAMGDKICEEFTALVKSKQ
jgi:3-isopropylmalate dehydrogenase